MDSVNHELSRVYRSFCAWAFVVFVTLIALALAIIFISKILRLIIKDEAKKPAAAPVQQTAVSMKLTRRCWQCLWLPSV